jgi:hypothetical protein
MNPLDCLGFRLLFSGSLRLPAAARAGQLDLAAEHSDTVRTHACSRIQDDSHVAFIPSRPVAFGRVVPVLDYVFPLAGFSKRRPTLPKAAKKSPPPLRVAAMNEWVC